MLYCFLALFKCSTYINDIFYLENRHDWSYQYNINLIILYWGQYDVVKKKKWDLEAYRLEIKFQLYYLLFIWSWMKEIIELLYVFHFPFYKMGKARNNTYFHVVGNK